VVTKGFEDVLRRVGIRVRIPRKVVRMRSWGRIALVLGAAWGAGKMIPTNRFQVG
jgi:hypothetical protein